jgi:hypothetical protein
MQDVCYTVSKGRRAYLASLPAASDAIKVLVLKAAGLVSETVMKDYATVAAILAGASDELTDASYSRKTCASVTVTIDYTNDRVDVDCANPTWTALAGAATGAVVFYYCPDTGAESDATNVPLSAHAWSVTPDGGDVTLVIDPAGMTGTA